MAGIKQIITDLLASADVQVNEDRPWDIQVHDERFYRMYTYDVLSCAGSFRARKNHQWQIVMTRNGKVRE